MRQITVRSCGTCPYYCSYYYDLKQFQTCMKNGNVSKISASEIHKDCPLADKVGREEAKEILTEIVKNADRIDTGMIEVYADKLGFKEEL